ncbi:hypothetical protein B0H14DRAFT_1470879 [Mycena olivaceomarginata]|nr:hypothetical protein B0H14DRAFT_1470879 [Mycena olivaceomarginata]
MSGATRSSHRPRHEIGTRHTPYNISSRSRLSITGLTEQNPSFLRTSFSTPALDLLSRSSQISCTQTSPPITLPPFRLAFPPAGSQLTHPSKYLPRIQGHLDSCSTPGSESGPSNPLLTDPVERASLHDRIPLSHFSTPRGNSLPAFGHQYHHIASPRSIHGSTFITAQNVHQQHGEVGIHILSCGIALDALYNSAERFPQPRCHPETRTQLLEKLYCWATDPDITRSIHWLHGPAGAGKSAVMQTLCERLRDAGQICGSFFFKRGDQMRGNAKVLFATLAYQLAICRHKLKSLISRNVETDPSILGRDMDVQLHTLIIEPCKWVQNDSTPVLLIDGLDECEGHHIQQEIIRLIQATANSHFCGLRILVASRPEPHIKETFEADFFQGVTDSTNIWQSFEDIRTYLRDEFSRIHREHSTMQNIPTPWPSSQILDILVRKSSGYFIYASTAIRFIGDEYFSPDKQLDIIIQNLSLDSESPFAALDELYIQILKGVPSRHLGILSDILSVIAQFPSHFGTRDIDELLGLEPGHVELILRPLHSLLKLANPFGRPMIWVHHASFLDFLKDGTRSSGFYVGSTEHKAKLGQSILKAFAYTYDDPQKNRADLGIYWNLAFGGGSWIHCITSLPPSADLVPHIQLVNPDFILDSTYTWHVDEFLVWLKEINPVPETLIRQWEEYHFPIQYEHFQHQIVVNLLEEREKRSLESNDTDILAPSLPTIYALHCRMTGEVQAIVTACRKLLSQSPDLVRIFHAGRLLTPDPSYLIKFCSNYLWRTHIVLDLSWDNILGCICSLHPLITNTSLFFHTLFLFLPAICWELDHLYPVAMVSRDLACGFLRLMQQIGRGERPMMLWYLLDLDDWHGREWGRHIRSSPQPDPELLQKLNQIVPPWEVFSEDKWTILEPIEFYDVVQWLKVSCHISSVNSHCFVGIPPPSTRLD